jgi:hypothetical protein
LQGIVYLSIFKEYNSKEIPGTLWIRVLNPPCSENEIKILEYDQTYKSF